MEPKGFPTLLAVVWFLTRVDALMLSKLREQSESFLTFQTFVWLLTKMDTLVLSQL